MLPAGNIMRSKGWASSGAFDRITSGKVLDFGQRALRRLDAEGIRLPASNRLARAIAVARKVQEGELRLTRDDSETLERIAEGNNLIVDLYYASATLNSPCSAIERAKILEAVEGIDVARGTGQQHSRNIQFELAVRALLRAGGVPAEFEEPDITFPYGKELVGVAAKRIWSEEQLRRRLGEGVDQIERSQRRGFIALNVSRYLGDSIFEASLPEKGASFNDHVARVHGQLPYLVGKKSVIGLLNFAAYFEWQFDAGPKPQLGMIDFTQVILFPGADDPEGGRFAISFFEAFHARVKQWFLRNL